MKYKEHEININEFINKFKFAEKNKALEKTFTNGFCYYFALILKTRFPKGHIYYDTSNHFIFKFKNKYYDIRGEVDISKLYGKLCKWDNYKGVDKLEYNRIVRDSIKHNDLDRR